MPTLLNHLLSCILARYLQIVIVLLTVMSANGCQPSNPLGRVAVSGTVTLDGVPIEEGTIEFAPQAGVGSGAKIINGRYAMEEVRGLPPGKYQVRVFAPKLPAGAKATIPGTPPGPPGPESNLLGVERVATKYNINTVISAEVPPNSESLTFDFAVTSK